MDQREKELKEYLLGYDRGELIGRLKKELIIFAVLWVACTAILQLISSDRVLLPLILLGAAGCLIYLLLRLLTGVWIPAGRLASGMRKAGTEEDLSRLLFDFETADEGWDGQLRLGEWWIFSRGSGRLVSYDDIICCSAEGQLPGRLGKWIAVLLDSEQRMICLCQIPMKADDVDYILSVIEDRRNV